MVRPDREKLMQFVRYCIVGTVAAGIHYAVYYLLQLMLRGGLWLVFDYTAGYVVSLVCNFFMTTWFTFKSRVSAGKVAGFGASHMMNYAIHIVLFNIFMAMGIHRLAAPVLVLMVAVPANFLLLRLVYRERR